MNLEYHDVKLQMDLLKRIVFFLLHYITYKYIKCVIEFHIYELLFS